MKKMKDLNAKVAVNLLVPAILKEKMEKAAKVEGVSFAQYGRDCFHFCAYLSPDFWKTLSTLSRLYGKGESSIIEEILKNHVNKLKSDAGFTDEKSEIKNEAHFLVEIPEQPELPIDREAKMKAYIKKCIDEGEKSQWYPPTTHEGQ